MKTNVFCVYVCMCVFVCVYACVCVYVNLIACNINNDILKGIVGNRI